MSALTTCNRCFAAARGAHATRARRVLARVALGLLVVLGVSHVRADPGLCPTTARPKVLAIGSSTMASLLGPALVQMLRKDGLDVTSVGVASSGLARPDFWDWADEARKLVAEHTPDVVVVELGTNDFQGIWEVDHWVRRSQPEWETIYSARIESLLEVLAGPGRERLILWVGPYAFAADNAIEQGPLVDLLMREGIAAWVAGAGRAAYIDAWAATSDKRGWPQSKRPLPGISSRPVDIRTKDGVHLTAAAVRSLFARPIVEHLRACVAAVAARDAAAEP